MTRLYFTCPIKALLMMKEFGVKFWANTGIGLINFADFEVSGEAISIEELLKITELYPKKLYVAKESEHIFDYKKGDLVNHKDQGFGIVDLSGKFIEFYNSITYPIACANSSKIIMRDNKQFFQAEIE